MASASPSFILKHASGNKKVTQGNLWKDIMTEMGGYYREVGRAAKGSDDLPGGGKA